MNDDLHDRCAAWLLEGARGQPARDVALHATLCPSCTACIAALDLLAVVDVAAAGLPATRPIGRAARVLSGARVTGGVVAVVLLAATGGVSLAQVLAPHPLGAEPATPGSRPPAQEVLGGVGGGSGGSTTPGSATPTASPTATVTHSPALPGRSVLPPTPVPPPPRTTQTTSPPPVATPDTTPPAASVPPSAPTSPTQAATLSPSAEPTATPTRSPEPSVEPTPEPTPEPTSSG